MASLNKVMLIGNLTRDPEIRYTPKGQAVTDIGLAVNRVYSTESGEKREEVTFIDVTLWGRTAEVVHQYCKKGRPLFVEGRLKLDSWDDKTSGQKRSKMKVVVETMQLLGSRDGGGGGGHDSTVEYADSQAAPSATSAPAQRRAPAQAPRPPVDPDLDAAPDDIPF